MSGDGKPPPDAEPFAGRRLILGVTGSIAAYKAVEVLRLLTTGGAEVTTILTRSALQFVRPLTFDVLSGRPCLVDQFEAEALKGSFIPVDDPDRAPIVHIDLARRADAVLVCPASANLIGKVANGIADDLLSVTIMAATGRVVFAPAMNDRMWENPIVQENVTRLRGLGYSFFGPGAGDLACGIGPGRLVDPQEIVDSLANLLEETGPLAGRTFLVSAGRTEEPIDPVRTIANRSSGRMGYAIAAAARAGGARVVLVSGPASLDPPAGVELHRVRTAAEMEERILAELPRADCLIMAAAVADFRPRQTSVEKLRRASGPSQIDLEPTPDILAAAASAKGDRLHIGFALETTGGLESARRKLAEKDLDLVVFNRADEPDAGADVETNRVVLVGPSGERRLPLMHKSDVAREIITEVTALLERKRNGASGRE